MQERPKGTNCPGQRFIQNATPPSPNVKAELGPYRNLKETYKLNVVDLPTSEPEVKQYKPRPFQLVQLIYCATGLGKMN